MGSILIKRARIINPAGEEDFNGDLFISGETIEVVGEDLFDCLSRADTVIDADGWIAAPGLVDMHVHLRDPGFTEKEDMYSACRAAAAGGVTAVLAMPNTNPTVDCPETVRYILDRAKAADADLYTAGSITKGLKGELLSDMSGMVKAGAVALSDDGRPVLSGKHLLKALAFAKENNILLAAHCEDLSIAEGGIINEGAVSKELGIRGIHRAAEDCGTAREIAAAAALDAPVHICHVSTKGSAELIRDAKRRGVKVTAETAPHYLLLTEKELRKRDADYKMNPPLRTEEDRLALIEALKDGTIDAIATDHAPHSPEEKGNFLRAPNGSIGMETSLSAVLTALRDEVPLIKIIQLMSVNPASLLRIPAGKLEAGGKANIVLFDENEYWTVDEKKLHGKSRNTPFKGLQLKGKVKYTIFRGRIVYSDKDE